MEQIAETYQHRIQALAAAAAAAAAASDGQNLTVKLLTQILTGILSILDCVYFCTRCE